jgi:predicted nucleotidyltransferase
MEQLKGKRDLDQSEAHQSSRDRDKAFEALDVYMYQFRKIARVVLKDKPEYMEKVGILYRTSPVRKKKPVVPPAPAPDPVTPASQGAGDGA